MAYVFLTPVAMSGLEVRDSRIETVGALPGMPDAAQTGRLVYHAALLKYSDGTSWTTLGASGAGGPPSGTAGGDLTGSYPNPTIAPLIIVDGDISTTAAIATSKINGLDTALTARALTTTDFVAGAGMTGGGTLASTRTFDVIAGTGIVVNANDVAVNTTTVQMKTERNAASGYAPLDSSVLVPVANLPALNLLTAPTADLNLNSKKITSLLTPTADTDAANKVYVDNLAAGLAWKDSVKCASTAQRALTGLTAIDGVTPIANDRVLLKNQTAPAENGIWVAQSGAWARATDAETEAELLNATVFVSEGSTLADTAWTMTTNAPITVGTTALTWVQFGAGTALTAGGGLTLTTNTLAVGAGTGITVNADDVAVNFAGTGSATTAAKSDHDHTGTYAPVSTTAKHFAGDVGSGTAVVITHNLNTRDVTCEVYRNTTPWDTVLCDVERTSVNTITLRFATSVTAAAYRCVVTGR